MGASEVQLPGLGSSLALSFVSLAVVCLLAYLVLRWLSRRGVGQSEGPVRLLGRCPLEPRRSVYLLEAAGRCFLIGAGEGPLSLLAEVDPAAVRVAAPTAISAGERSRFANVLARVMGRDKG